MLTIKVKTMSTYFDLHFHPLFKQFITRFETSYPTQRGVDELLKEMDLENNILDIVDEIALHILQSQSCVEQITEGGIRLGVAAIASLELGIADSKGFIAQILRSNLTKPMDRKYFQSIRNGEISYYRLFLKELDLFRRVAEKNHLVFLSRKDPRNIDEKAAYMVLGMEGGHNLSRKKIGRHEPDGVEEIGDHILWNDLARNPGADAAESLQLLQQALWNSGFDLFYITLTHLTYINEQHLATHAYGLKLLSHEAFYPVGNGLSEEGRKLIDTAYNMQVKDGEDTERTPILIDIKHMSLKSRLDFYKLRKEKGHQPPILATHMGVTGYSVEEWKDALTHSALLKSNTVKAVEVMMERKKAGEWGFINKNFTYNPWSINLMNEDIIEIIESDGLIGISLDVRILGFQALIGASSKDQPEYLSMEDFKTFFPRVKVEGIATESLMPADAESWLKPTKEERHPLCLCFNIVHIVSVGMISTSRNPWDHVCIGSDFDGLIDPVKVCRDSSKMAQLEADLIRWMPVAEKAYLEQNGGFQLLKRDTTGNVDQANLKSNIRKIMYGNGKTLVENWMKKKWTEGSI